MLGFPPRRSGGTRIIPLYSAQIQKQIMKSIVAQLGLFFACPKACSTVENKLNHSPFVRPPDLQRKMGEVGHHQHFDTKMGKLEI